MAEAVERKARSVSLAELQGLTGCNEELASELVKFGLIEPVAGLFDANSIEVTKSAAELASRGVEPRHLRQFRTAADREFSLIESIVGNELKARGFGSRPCGRRSPRDLAPVLENPRSPSATCYFATRSLA